ncbi:hypothetical protein SUGI_0356390 [Cryptomeria japonica]|uniref:bZIP transcription factor 11-like n=1 Tax=Cryptomeria japonica TaxID=3369 RepID=UPI002408E22D|nr:bZIP transcription factor 11-like [Cryptomeria japonica]GLJ19675.1 hypothetical protein SUGI_0356390 [Cryptomeria japonica]
MVLPSNLIVPNSTKGVSASTNPKTSSSGRVITQQSSGSEKDPNQIIDKRKHKRMIANRESARKPRLRKQQHLDELNTDADYFRAENNMLFTKLNIVSHNYMQLQEENSLLRSHAMDLSHKLQSLNIKMQWEGVMHGLDLTSSDGFVHPIPMDMKSWYL